jgi:hypothetical protein
MFGLALGLPFRVAYSRASGTPTGAELDTESNAMKDTEGNFIIAE